MGDQFSLWRLARDCVDGIQNRSFLDGVLVERHVVTEAYTPGPLPIIAAVCRESGLVETINDLVDWDEQQCTLSPGERVMGL